MSDLISRQKVIKRIEELPNSPNGYSATYDKASIIMAIEEVEPVEFVHAHWISHDDDGVYHECSNCGVHDYWNTSNVYIMFDYCPDCGAIMDKEME